MKRVKVVFVVKLVMYWRCQLLRSYLRWEMSEWVWSTGGIIMTRKPRSAQSKTCPHATLSTTDPTRTGLGVKPTIREAKFPLSLSTVPIIKIISKHPISATDIEERILRSGGYSSAIKAIQKVTIIQSTSKQWRIHSCHCRKRSAYVQQVSSHCTEWTIRWVKHT
jgi:hypothetical protein